jgi:hypothetical protein
MGHWQQRVPVLRGKLPELGHADSLGALVSHGLWQLLFKGQQHFSCRKSRFDELLEYPRTTQGVAERHYTGIVCGIPHEARALEKAMELVTW